MTDDEARFVDIYRRFGKPIQAYCARRTSGSQVADAVADTFLVAWRRIDEVPDRGGNTALALRSRLQGPVPSVAAPGSESASGREASRPGGCGGTRRRTCSWCRSEEHRVVLAASEHLKSDRPGDSPPHPLGGAAHMPTWLWCWASKPPRSSQRAYRARKNLADEYQQADWRSPTPRCSERRWLVITEDQVVCHVRRTRTRCRPWTCSTRSSRLDPGHLEDRSERSRDSDRSRRRSRAR